MIITADGISKDIDWNGRNSERPGRMIVISNIEEK